MSENENNNVVYYCVEPLEPLVARDSRPIGNNSGRARSLDWLTPSVLAGAVRSELWRLGVCTELDVLKSVKVSGGFLIANDELCFPFPHDALIGKPEGVTQRCFRVRPMYSASQGVYLPPSETENVDRQSTDLLARVARLKSFRFCSADLGDDGENFKPDMVAPLWPGKVMNMWLDESVSLDDFCDLVKKNGQKGAWQDERVHVRIDGANGTAEKGILYSSVGLDFVRKMLSQAPTSSPDDPDEDDENDGKIVEYSEGALSVRVDFGKVDASRLPKSFCAPVGGDRHLAQFTRCDEDGKTMWACPDKTLKGTHLRMILTTPALFAGGWLPGWINPQTCKGDVPGTEICSGGPVSVTLVSTVLGRWKPVSGWSYEDQKPKPLRRMAPEGSVYFFIADKELDAEQWQVLWLNSVSDDEQDRADGFGLALWGDWSDEKATASQVNKEEN